MSQAKAHVEETESQIPPLEELRRRATNRLCVLLGMPPQDITGLLRGMQPIPVTPSQVALGVPADLLRHRPDVLEAKAQVAAESARIGVATADLYPHLCITGDIGVDSSEFAELFEPQSLSAFIGPSFHWDILNYGRLANNVRVHDMRFQERAFTYQSIVLRAYQEAEDALVGFLKAQQRFRSLAQSTQDSKRSVELALTQYREGTADYNRVYTMERLLAEVQDQMAAAQGEVPRNLVLLYKAMGGGWEKPLAAVGPASPPASGQPAAPVAPTPLPESIPTPPPPAATAPVSPGLPELPAAPSLPPVASKTN